MYEGNAAKKLIETEELTAKEIIEKRRAFAEKKRKRYIKQTNPNLYKLMEYQDTRHERAKRRVEKRAETKEKIMRIPAEMVRISFLDYVIHGVIKSRNSINKSFVVFLSIVSIFTVIFCVDFIQTRAELTKRISDVAKLETELMTLKSDNDAYEASIKGNVNINTVKNIAINKLGMKYPDPIQVMYYKKSSKCNRFMQYQDIPQD